MRVGMNRNTAVESVEVIGVPHACGDEPAGRSLDQGRDWCSPCVWG